jgi:hypothetical protein
MTVHYYWVGAVPAMVFLSIVMMPFYYGSKAAMAQPDWSDEEPIARTEEVEERSASRAGLFDSPDEIAKAQGVRVNLWTGLGMLLLGLFFLGWQWPRPLQPGQRTDRGRPAGGVSSAASRARARSAAPSRPARCAPGCTGSCGRRR